MINQIFMIWLRCIPKVLEKYSVLKRRKGVATWKLKVNLIYMLNKGLIQFNQNP